MCGCVGGLLFGVDKDQRREEREAISQGEITCSTQPGDTTAGGNAAAPMSHNVSRAEQGCCPSASFSGFFRKPIRVRQASTSRQG